MDEHIAHSATSRERLRRLIARLDDEQLAAELDGGWTVSATLAHLAFWDRFVLARWKLYDRDGLIVALPDETVDLVNEAAIQQWIAVPPRTAVGLALAAAEEVDEYIARATPEAIDAMRRAGRTAMLDRSRHRNGHLDGIERQLE